MGAVNRQVRRRQEREQVRSWKEQGRYDQVLSLQRNGITQKDLDRAYNDGYEKGYLQASKGFFRKMYAACAKELFEAGNPKNDIVTFLRNVDHRFAIMFDAEDEIEEVYQLIGVHLNVDTTAIDRIEED